MGLNDRFLRRLENFYGCPYDFVEIFDGPQSQPFSLGRFCSSVTPIFTSSSNRLTVVFHSDTIVTNVGFHAAYESLVQEESTGRSSGLSPALLVVMASSDSMPGDWTGEGFPCSFVCPSTAWRKRGVPAMPGSTAPLCPDSRAHLC